MRNTTDEDKNDKLGVIKCSLKFRYKLICAFVKSISTNMRYKKVWFFNQMCVFNSHVIRMAGSRQHVLECTVRSNLFARSLHWLSYLVNGGNVECGPRHLRLRARHNWSKGSKTTWFQLAKSSNSILFYARTNRNRMPTSFTFTFVHWMWLPFIALLVHVNLAFAVGPFNTF